MAPSSTRIAARAAALALFGLAAAFAPGIGPEGLTAQLRPADDGAALGGHERAGWIGVSVDVHTEGDGRTAPSTTIHVVDARPGDALVEVNDLRGPADLPALLSRLRLRPGDPVRLVVRSGGTEREVRLVAVPRPDALAPLPPAVGPAHPDSVVESIVRAMDSLRMRLADGRELRIRMAPEAPPSGATPRAAPPAAPRAPQAPMPTGEVRAYSPLLPYLLGRNRVAGAEVIDLRPELARYFGVEGGVLVVDVPEDTPAADAGLEPGDVIVAFGGTPVPSVDELRARVTWVGAGRDGLTVIRHGGRLELTLRR